MVIASRDKATVNGGVLVHSGTGSTAVLRNVVGLYGTHIHYEQSSTATRHDPGRERPGPAARLVPGPVTDAPFTRPPVDGTTAVDSADKRLHTGRRHMAPVGAQRAGTRSARASVRWAAATTAGSTKRPSGRARAPGIARAAVTISSAAVTSSGPGR